MFRNILPFGGKDLVVDKTLPDSNPLSSLVNDHQVTVHSKPYRYAVIENFFKPDTYNHMCQEMQAILDRGISTERDEQRFSKFVGYDASSHTPDPKNAGAMSVLYTPEWIDYFSSLFNIAVNQDTIVSCHHHTVGSTSGFKHNDYITSSFVDDHLPNGVNAWYFQCENEDSSGDQPGTHLSTRAITMLYYLNNECEGKFGGETAIYKDDKIVDQVRPKNNTMLTFEISPLSYHAFLTNTKYPRNSIIQWFHQDPDIIRSRFNDQKPLAWKRRK